MAVEGERKKVLVVDDISDNIEILRKALSELDIEIISAHSGNEALRATLYDDFSLIILDIVMPGMSGLEVAEVLKQDEATSDIPIIFITAQDKDEACELKAYSKGAVDFIYKPFNKAILLSKVKVLLFLYSMKKNVEQAFHHHETTKPKILIVDDIPENLLVLRKILTKLNVEIVEAQSGNEALAKTLYNDFAVIFLDVQMPAMDGFEVAELLKSDEKTAGIPIIFITAIDRDDAKEIKGYDKGAVDFIFKPFNEFILLSKARIFLDIYRMRAGLEALVAQRNSDLIETNRRLQKEIQNKEKAEQQLIKTRSYLASVINSSPSVIVCTDKAGTVVLMNSEAEQLASLSTADARGKPVYEIFPLFGQTLQELLPMASTDKPIEKSNIFIEIDRKKLIYRFNLYPLVGADSDQVVFRIDDVTKEKEMENELNQRRHIESLGQLAGGVAHDFNNMLSAIIGAAELLKMKTENEPECGQLIDSMLTSGERAADLTRKLLSFARNKGNKSGVVDIHLLIHEIVSILQRSVDKRISIVLELYAGKSIVMGDDAELSNAILNLAINARDAMPEGGYLTISTDNVEIETPAHGEKLEIQDGDYIRLCVMDTGTGMTEEVKRKAFEPFFTTKEAGHGTGLGLASVYGTIKAHAGAIKVESTPGEGSIFTILLPVVEETAAGDSSRTQSVVREKFSGTVLLVDDEEIVRHVGAELLGELGMNVIIAENGSKAIELVKQKGEEIALILLDMIMPVMNGPDCFKQIRRINPNAKIVICSGFAPGEMIARLHQEGLNGFIQKPFRFAQFKKVLSSCLSDRIQSTPPFG